MKREDLNYPVGIILLIFIIITGVLGYIQSQLELRKFIPHRYFAYTTLGLVALHVYLNGGRVVRYLRKKLRRGSKSSVTRTGGRDGEANARQTLSQSS